MATHFSKATWLIFMVFFILLASPGDIRAQEDNEDRSLQRWNVMLDWIELELNESEILTADFDHYEQRLGALIDNAGQFKARTNKALETPQLELDTLGTPPEEGEPAETSDINAQRDAIQEEIAQLSQRVKQAELIQVRAEQLLKQLGGTQRQQLETRLLTRSPAIYTSRFWTDFLADASHIGRGLSADAQALLRGQGRGNGSAWLILVLVLAAALTTIPGGRWLTDRYGRRPQANESSYSQRTLSAFAEGVASGLLPAAIFGGIGWALVSQGLVGEQSATLVKAVTTSLVLAIVIVAPVQAALVPHAPNWRLVSVDSTVAARVNRRIQWLVVFCATMLALYLATERYRPYANEIDVVSNLVITLVIGTLLLSSLHQRFWRPAASQQSDEQSHRALEAIRRVLMMIVVCALALGLFGYLDLSAFLVSRLAITIGTVCALLMVRRLLHEFLERLSSAWHRIARLGRESSTGTSGMLIRGILDILLLGPMLLLLAKAWGIPQAVIQLWSRRLLDGATIGELTFSPGSLLLAILVFSIVLIATRLLRRIVYDRVLPETHMDFGLRHSIFVGIGYLGIALAAILAVATLGVGLRNMALVFGALSVGVGLGLQGIVGNFMSGLILLAQRPVRVGDWIAVGEHEGIVRNIMSVSTEIETFDKASIIIPNSELVSNSLVNWTHTDTTVRVIISIGIEHGADVDQVQALLLDCASRHNEVLTTPEPYALLTDFGESALLFELRVFVTDAERYHIVASQLRIMINQACREANIEIPYPQRHLHMDAQEIRSCISPSAEDAR
ncbi:DUF3772 domain-containing protein [Granulosicoccus sp. 3-233]|uniref:DUF3772 domain-containing protein n=1 Tax=Granulosicoccus sp. 3-233 TaxID=3417969 RepID=UPI003D334102